MHETRKWSSATRRMTVESWIIQMLKYRRQTVQCSVLWNNNNNNNNNNRGDWDYYKVNQKIREQHTRKTLRQGITENSHIGHCTHTSERTNVKVQQNSCNTLFPRDIVYFRNISINTLHKGDDDDDNLATMRLGHLLTRCGLTQPKVSSMVSPGSLCRSV